jgi:septum site-determining protein MinC
MIDLMKKELNQNNISIKAIVATDESPILRAKEANVEKMQEESSSIDEKELIDTSYLPETLFIEANLRSGQLVRYPGNVFVLGDVNPSAEIIASGDIIIWGILRGIVHAGANGDHNAKIIAMDIATGQIRIADEMLSIDKNKLRDLRNIDSKGFNIGSLLGKTHNEAEPASRIPLLAKIRNNEIIVARYF